MTEEHRVALELQPCYYVYSEIKDATSGLSSTCNCELRQNGAGELRALDSSVVRSFWRGVLELSNAWEQPAQDLDDCLSIVKPGTVLVRTCNPTFDIALFVGEVFNFSRLTAFWNDGGQLLHAMFPLAISYSFAISSTASLAAASTIANSCNSLSNELATSNKLFIEKWLRQAPSKQNVFEIPGGEITLCSWEGSFIDIAATAIKSSSLFTPSGSLNNANCQQSNFIIDNSTSINSQNAAVQKGSLLNCNGKQPHVVGSNQMPTTGTVNIFDTSTFADSASATTATTAANTLAYVQSQFADCFPTPAGCPHSSNSPIAMPAKSPEDEFFSACLLRAGSECDVTPPWGSAGLAASKQLAELVRQKLQQAGASNDDKSMYVFNIRAIHRNIHKWKSLFPNCKLLHPLTSNSDNAVLEVAAFAGADGFTCAFPGHWAQLRNAGASVRMPHLVIYDGGLGKTTTSIDAARLFGANTCVVDTVGDVKRLAETWASEQQALEQPLNLIVRVAVDSLATGGASIAVSKLRGVRQQEWPTLFDAVDKFNARLEESSNFVRISGVKVDGFSYSPNLLHSGCSSEEREAFISAAFRIIAKQFELAVDFYRQIQQRSSCPASKAFAQEPFIVILGSVPLVPTNREQHFAEYRELLNKLTAELQATNLPLALDMNDHASERRGGASLVVGSLPQQQRGSPSFGLFAEPSDFILHDVGFLATRVFARRFGIGEVSSSNPVLYYVCDGIYHNLGSKIYRSMKFEPQVLMKESWRDTAGTMTIQPTPTGKMPCKIFGQTCDGFDCILEGYDELPLLEIGDWLWFDSQGSNGNISTNFNGFDIGNKIYACI